MIAIVKAFVFLWFDNVHSILALGIVIVNILVTI